MKCIPIAALMIIFLPMSPVRSEDYRTVWVEVGESTDIYWELNLKGKLYLYAEADGKAACLDYWWIVWPLSQIKKLGTHCGKAEFEIPGLRQLALGGKLRAGNATVRTKVIGTSSELVARTLPLPRN